VAFNDLKEIEKMCTGHAHTYTNTYTHTYKIA